MTSQHNPNQKTQNDEYSHADPDRLRKQSKVNTEIEASEIAEEKKQTVRKNKELP